MFVQTAKMLAASLTLSLTMSLQARAQMLIGTQGMINAPTADMNDAGTFVGGLSFVPKQMELVAGNFDTGIYYIDFTPFKWLELTFRETLLKTTKIEGGVKKTGYYQQDRSTTLRLRPIKEKDKTLLPSVAVGVNDMYSDHGSSRYTCAYGVVTKHLPVASIGTVGLHAGYAYKFDTGVVYDGVFGGIDFRPSFCKDIRAMAEWDSQGINLGFHAVLLRHVNLTVFTREFGCVGAGVSYQYTIRY